jgi:perosamine synthetase
MYSDKKDVEAVGKVIKRGTYWAEGPEVEEFERNIARFIGTKYALVFNSGTSALQTLLMAHDVKGKEVIVPSFTFIATANVVILAGGIPVFAESESETLGLDADDVKKRITNKTKAIIPLHYGGFPSRDIVRLREIADENDLLVIDDAAESFGARIGSKKVGTFGHSAMFSLCQNKVITTGEGGIIVTNLREVFEKAKLIRSHGRVETAEDYFSFIGDNDYIQAGYNFRLPTILAAIGLSQLNKVERVIKLRRRAAYYLAEHLSKIEEVVLPKEKEGHFSVYQMYTIQLKDERTRDALQNHLAKNGIMSKVYFHPVHLKTIYRRDYGYKEGDLPKTENISKRVLNIPLYPTIKKEELNYLINAIAGFFEKN